MASNKLTATILILSLLAHSTFKTEACCCTPCEPPPPVTPEPSPPAPVTPEPSPPAPVTPEPCPPAPVMPEPSPPAPVTPEPSPPVPVNPEPSPPAPVNPEPSPPAPVNPEPSPPAPVNPEPSPPAPVKPEPCPPAPVKPEPCPPAPAVAHCPKDTLKLGACADLLGVVNVVVGAHASSKCCALLEGLADLEAALCLCTAIEANVLGVNLNVALTLSLLLSACQKTVPPGFQCA